MITSTPFAKYSPLGNALQTIELRSIGLSPLAILKTIFTNHFQIGIHIQELSGQEMLISLIFQPARIALQ
jgi:hypothetical protein